MLLGGLGWVMRLSMGYFCHDVPLNRRDDYYGRYDGFLGLSMLGLFVLAGETIGIGVL